MTDIDNRTAGERIAFGPFSLFPHERLLTRNGDPVEIGGRSLDLLITLARQPGQVLSKRDLLQTVWSDVVVEDGSLRFHMAGLRKLLGDGKNGARYIATQVGVGYAFVAKVERDATQATVGVPVVAHQTPVFNLPPRQSGLIGRERDIALLADRVVDTPLFTIVGPGGVGKTSLAVEMGHVLAAPFDGRVAFVDFSMLENPALVPGMIAGAMGLAVQGDDPLAVMIGHMRAGRFLLMLDNCEHLIGQVAALVERLIEAAPQVRILATSREPLRIRGEHIHRLDALAYPTEGARMPLEELLTFPAVRLFCDRARAADSRLEIDAEAASLIATICRQLDGMALAIELAAVRVATHGLASTAKQLEARFSLGWIGRRTAQPRQQTLEAMLNWSYDLLSGNERIVLERLAVFVGPFSVDAAVDVVSDAETDSRSVILGIDSLSIKSLIYSDTMNPGTYRMLEMTRAYAREKLSARGATTLDAAAGRHAAYFLAELEAIAAQDEDMAQDVGPLRQQLGNIRSALDWSFGATGNRRIGLRLVAASTPAFLTLSHFVECQSWCARALEALGESQRGTELEMELQGALGLALMFSRGSTPTAEAALSQALAVATDRDDPWAQLRMLGRLHIFAERVGDCTAAMDHASRAVVIAAGIGQPEAMGVARSLSGISHYLAGDQRRARDDLEFSLAHCPMFSRHRVIYYGFDHRARTTIALARTLWLSGQAERATALTAHAVDQAVRLDQPVLQCIALIWAIGLNIWKGDRAAARAALDDFAECAQVNALGPYIIAATAMRADLSIRQGEAGDALNVVEDSQDKLRAARYELLTTALSISRIRGLLLAGRRHDAAMQVDDAIARCARIGEGFALPELWGLKAETAQAGGDADGSIRLLEQALKTSRDQGALAWALRIVVPLASQLVDQGNTDKAARTLKTVMAEMSGTEHPIDLASARDLLHMLEGRMK